MNARELMTEHPATCAPDESIVTVARLMADHDCGCIPVVDPADGHILGVVTDRDIAIRGVAANGSRKTRITDVMTRSPFCCDPEARIDSVEHIMTDHQIRRVVVVDELGRVVGVVSQADIARAAERGDGVRDDDVGRIVEIISRPIPEARTS